MSFCVSDGMWGRAARVAVRVALLCAMLVAPGASSLAQGVSLESLTDIELWKTSDSSRLLARNNGRLAVAGLLRLWAAWRPAPTLELRVLGSVYGGSEAGQEMESEIELLTLRYFPSRAFILEGGKILQPMGGFGSRRFSNTNPLIGAPDMYPAQYPWGLSVSGAAGPVDYRAALVSLPPVNEQYSPLPDHRLRPLFGLGVSAGPAFHLGATVTSGPYLGAAETQFMPFTVQSTTSGGPPIPGQKWDGPQQRLVSAETRYSVGYFEARAEAAWSSYEVPTIANPLKGFGWYSEVRATLSPRWFVAARYEHFDYPFILPVSRFFWVGNVITQMNGEAGVGYRVSADALLKVSLRKDHWPVHVLPGNQSFPDGYALATQFSLHTDLVGLFAHQY